MLHINLIWRRSACNLSSNLRSYVGSKFISNLGSNIGSNFQSNIFLNLRSNRRASLGSNHSSLRHLTYRHFLPSHHLSTSSSLCVLPQSRKNTTDFSYSLLFEYQGHPILGNFGRSFRYLSGFKQQQNSRSLTGAANTQSRIMTKSYEDAVTLLNTLQSNAATIQIMKEERKKTQISSMPDMREMIHRVGLTVDDIDSLSVVHISGTKGKGSTCAYCESILRSHGLKTGFFSSPHLVEVRERIRINGRSLSKDAFAYYFFQCYDKLLSTKEEHGGRMPAYFRFLTIMAYYVFKQEKVDAAIMEVGIGGEYDCTNVVSKPIVCGVASLGIDHTSILGETIEEIAWHKAGIFKSGVPAVTVPQPQSALDVLYKRAEERSCKLYVAPPLSSYIHNNCSTESSLSLGIPGMHQSVNASLALQLCRIWLDAKGIPSLVNGGVSSNIGPGDSFHLTSTMAAGLENCVWPGRCQKIVRPRLTYYLDGAHTTESMEVCRCKPYQTYANSACAAWFAEESSIEAKRVGGNVKRVLIFNMTGDRKSQTMLEALLKCSIDYALFCPNIEMSHMDKPDSHNNTVTYECQMQRCYENGRAWLELLHQTEKSSGDGKHVENLSNGSSAVNHRFENGDNVKDLSSNNSIKDDITKQAENHCDVIKNEADGKKSIAAELLNQKILIFDTILDSLVYATAGRDLNVQNLLNHSRNRDVVVMNKELSETDHIQVLISGSLLLVGNTLGLLDPDVCEKPACGKC